MSKLFTVKGLKCKLGELRDFLDFTHFDLVVSSGESYLSHTGHEGDIEFSFV